MKNDKNIKIRAESAPTKSDLSDASVGSLLARREIGEGLMLRGISYCADLADEGTPWESVAEPEQQYFATFLEALDFQFKLREKRESAPQAQTEQDQTINACVQTIIDDVLSGKQAEFLHNRVRARILAIIGLYKAGPVFPPSTPGKNDLERARLTFFYIRNLTHDAWRDPPNLEAVCQRIEGYATMEYDLLGKALEHFPVPPAEESKPLKGEL